MKSLIQNLTPWCIYKHKYVRLFSVIVKYQSLVNNNTINHDEFQSITITKLQKVYENLLIYKPPQVVNSSTPVQSTTQSKNDSLFEAFFNKKEIKPIPNHFPRSKIASAPNGLYIYGIVFSFERKLNLI